MPSGNKSLPDSMLTHPYCHMPNKQLGPFLFQIQFHFLMLFIMNMIFLSETGPIQWVFVQHCGYWWPGALAPVCTHAFPTVYGLRVGKWPAHCRIWSISSYSHSPVIIMVADGLVPIWLQDICNHQDDVYWTKHFEHFWNYSVIKVPMGKWQTR